ncbi:hypothetical protein EV193_105280 [Herbihabitans rhizosphaerae]|uniref:VCBS repeat protein n=1 Tax=Herbihabitans rhizosphaerae TaxID=1872711 RepID=A0A4Q7KQW0_9PSEU|nr:hypothetical protein [Herbihabitans rhizosphaerae]RZS37722.1 hypothetical protein EV193_105280 [Herbihabitans rhizosphaerae]
MYVDDNGDTGGTGTEGQGTDQHMAVEINGQEHDLELNYDLDHDGNRDAAVVQTDRGYMAFVDSNHDGAADKMVQLDEQGKVLGEARYDAATKEWVAVDPGQNAGQAGGAGAQGHITVETGTGGKDAGAATHDVTGDGKNDTVIVRDEAGNAIAYTDLNGDGKADQALVTKADGEVVLQKHTGGGVWTEVDKDTVPGGETTGYQQGENGVVDTEGWADSTPTEGVARIDTATGQWISQN